MDVHVVGMFDSEKGLTFALKRLKFVGHPSKGCCWSLQLKRQLVVHMSEIHPISKVSQFWMFGWLQQQQPTAPSSLCGDNNPLFDE